MDRLIHLKKFIETVQSQEKTSGVIPERCSSLYIPKHQSPESPLQIVLTVHDGATTPLEFDALAKILAHTGFVVCNLLLPQHGTPDDTRLKQFCSETAIQNVLSFYNGINDCQPDKVHIIGFSTGSLIALQFIARMNPFPKNIKSLILINPYLKNYFSNRLLLKIIPILKISEVLSLGLLSRLIEFFTGHKLDLKNSYFYFNTLEICNKVVPFKFLIQENHLIEDYSNQVKNHSFIFPKDLKILSIYNHKDRYIDTPSSKQLLDTSLKNHPCYQAIQVNFKNQHSILPLLSQDKAILEQILQFLN